MAGLPPHRLAFVHKHPPLGGSMKIMSRNFTPEERFFDKVRFCPMTGCWLWAGACITPFGYGKFIINGKPVLAHRWSWEFHNNRQIPDGLVIDHFVCDTPRCVNPDHLRPVTSAQNVARSKIALSACNARKEVCPKCGGEFSIRKNGSRICRPCQVKKSILWNKSNRRKKNADCS